MMLMRIFSILLGVFGLIIFVATPALGFLILAVSFLLFMSSVRRQKANEEARRHNELLEAVRQGKEGLGK